MSIYRLRKHFVFKKNLILKSLMKKKADGNKEGSSENKEISFVLGL
jgi:hypothetical protein